MRKNFLKISRDFIFVLSICLVSYVNTVDAFGDVLTTQQSNYNNYIQCKHIENGKEIVVPDNKIERSMLSRGCSSITEDLVQYSFRFLGKPYVWAADGPAAFDCSGFTAYVYGRYGYSLPHYTGYQVTMGKNVEKNELIAGDLIFFNTTGANSHVGIYIGNGKFIHASSGKGSITISELGKQYYRERYSTARRIIE